MRNSRWMRHLAYVTGFVNQELLFLNEYLAAENRILRAKLPARLRLSNPERTTVAEIGKRLGRKALREVACVAKPDSIQAARLFPQKSKRWWSEWRERTRAGAMTESSVRSPTWVIGCRIRR